MVRKGEVSAEELLDATEGAVLGDPYAAPTKERPFLDEVTTDPGRLRIAYTVKPPNGKPIHEDCIQATLDTVKLWRNWATKWWKPGQITKELK